MLKIARLGMILIVVLACLTLTACAGGKKEAAVVRVGNNEISAATISHWVLIESETSHGGARVTESQPVGSLPVPPEYKGCVAYLIRISPSPLSSEAARVHCAFQYKIYKETILSILISYYWDTEEGAAKGLRISDGEVRNYLKQLYPHPGEFGRYLKLTHETLADERLLVRGKLMTEKLVTLSSRNARSQAERVHAITKHIEDEAAKWAPRTSCSPGYVVPQCKQFHGPHALV